MLSYIFIRNFAPWRLLMALGVALLVSACATHSGYETNSDGTVEPYGFFSGMWHGLILPFAVFFAILFNVLVNIVHLISWTADLVFGPKNGLPLSFHWLDFFDFVGQPNTGFFYYVGYLIGLGESLGGGSAANQRRG